MKGCWFVLALCVLALGCKSEEEKLAEFAETVAQGIKGCSSKPGIVKNHIEVQCESTTTSEEWVMKIEPALKKKCAVIGEKGFDVFIVDWGGSHRDSIKCKE